MPVINVRFAKSVLADLEGMAKDMDCSRGEIIRKLVDYAIENLGDEDEDQDEETEICDECKAEIPSDAKFCPECGIEFEEEDDSDEDEEEDESANESDDSKED